MPSKKHKRINDIFFGPLERPLLAWLASHMPDWVSPDLLTTIGMFGSAVIFLSYWLTNYQPVFLWVASLGFVINWFGDSLDGTLARYRNIQRPRYGFFIDHTMDALSQVLIFLGLGLSPYVQFNLASLALVGYLLMSVLVYIRTYIDGEFRISYAKLGPTEARVIAIVSNALVYFAGTRRFQFPFGAFTLYDMIAIVIIVILFSMFLTSTFKQANQLSKSDKPRADVMTEESRI